MKEFYYFRCLKVNGCRGLVTKHNELQDMNSGKMNYVQCSSDCHDDSVDTSNSNEVPDIPEFQEYCRLNHEETSESGNMKKLKWKTILFYPPIVACYFANFCATFGFLTFAVNQVLFKRDLYSFEVQQVYCKENVLYNQ